MAKRKWYKLKITQQDVPKPHKNIRDVELSFVTSCTELHRIIQELYGLQDCHLRNITNSSTRPTREVIPGGKMHYNLDGIEQDPDSILLSQFISKKFKTVYYTYDFWVNHEFKIEYKWLTNMPEGIKYWRCMTYEWFNVIENIPIRQQTEFMEIYQDKDKKKLQSTIDWFETREEFEEWISWAFEPVEIDELNTRIQQVKMSER